MTTFSAERLAALHADAFEGASRWSRDAFATALADPRCYFVSPSPPAMGFALGRVAADEVELLTLVVAPTDRRKGIGRNMLAQFEDAAIERGAAFAFLEVAADNAAARMLYEQAGWRSVGTRPAYYAGRDAILMRKDLGAI